jgi:diguanylate cyclase (GGDEF)-like protein
VFLMLDVTAAIPSAGWPLHALVLRHRLERARRDPLTGLPTRDMFQARAARILARRPGALVVLIDLDGLKPLNDTPGHAAGDAVLVHVARRLARYAGPGGAAGRLGGDEFAAVLPGTDHTNTLRLLHAALTEPVHHDGAILTFGASIGGHHAAAHTVLADALAGADTAMYEAKNHGGGYRLDTTTEPLTPLAGAGARRWKRTGPVHTPCP